MAGAKAKDAVISRRDQLPQIDRRGRYGSVVPIEKTLDRKFKSWLTRYLALRIPCRPKILTCRFADQPFGTTVSGNAQRRLCPSSKNVNNPLPVIKERRR
jgi:hypothetical protein